MTKPKNGNYPSRNPECDMPPAIPAAIRAWASKLPAPLCRAIQVWAVTLEQRERAADEIWEWMLTQINIEGRDIVGDVSRERRQRERAQITPMPQSWITDCDKPGPRPK